MDFKIRGITKNQDTKSKISPKQTIMTRENQVTETKIDNAEYVFKKALTVQRLIEEGKLRGESIISHLQSKVFPEVAL